MKIVRLFLGMFACIYAAATTSAAAQSKSLWMAPVNLSRSGGASAALLTISPDDRAYALWWDAVDGVRFTTGDVQSATVEWTDVRGAAGINGGKDERDPQRPVTLPPQRASFLAGAGVAYLTYFTIDDQLMSARLVRGEFEPVQVVADDAIEASASIDMSGTLHLGYAMGGVNAETAGIYYSRLTGQSRTVLVAASPYLRGAKAGDVQMDVAGDGSGNIVIVWRQRGEVRGRFARSDDGGRSWTEPQEIAPRSGLLGAHAYVSTEAVGPREFLLLWRDLSVAGCGIMQRRSSDGGATWDGPQRVLENAAPCPAEWRLQQHDGEGWLVGAPQGGVILLAQRDESGWSRVGTVQMTALEDARGASGSLLGYRCLGSAFGGVRLGARPGARPGARLGLIGCDGRGDVFVVLSRGVPDDFVTDVRARWSLPRTLYSAELAPHVVVAAHGKDGDGFVGWTSGRSIVDTDESVLMLSARVSGQWRPAQSVLQVYDAEFGTARAIAVRRPALAVDDRRVHAVWQGGSSGRAYYSSAARRDAETREGWSAPVALPAPTQIGGAPALVIDPRSGALVVMYAVPYNEGRGVYVVRSEDGGVTWREPRKVIDATAWPAVDQVQLALDSRTSTWHAVFLQMAAADGRGWRALRHAYSNDGGETWVSTDAVLAEGDLSAPRLGLLGDGRVVVIWNRERPIEAQASDESAAPYETWSRMSPDGGRSWTARARVPGFGAVSGEPALVADAAGRIFLGAVGKTDEATAVLLTTAFDASGWLAPDMVFLHQPAARENTVALLVDGRKGTLDAVLRVAALQADGAMRPRIDTLQRQIEMVDAASSASTAVPAALAEPTMETRRAVTATPTALVITMVETRQEVSVASPLVWGALSAAGLVGLALVMWRVRRVRR